MSQRDIFVESQQPVSTFEISADQKYKVAISSENLGDKISLNVAMKQSNLENQYDFASYANAIFYAGVVSSVLFVALALYSLFNFVKKS